MYNGSADKLKGEIAIHVHLDTLKRVEIFQNTEVFFVKSWRIELKCFRRASSASLFSVSAPFFSLPETTSVAKAKSTS